MKLDQQDLAHRMRASVARQSATTRSDRAVFIIALLLGLALAAFIFALL